ncbi:MAG TPA: UDP-2,4-diacetamido-2,4,6-trideoxy-beta-L-altropyranose hydrolase [Candidatus Omnitrophota bacterium]|nr:UDP-2,4-diacetamido-2,4,6-trideoxy-beta-L-altropyranose hydrolase [Candidatus Omnitrophota bacterium]
MQPNFFPWPGYFNLIHESDIFVFYDDVQYVRESWNNRNRILLDGKPHWITVPCVRRGLDQKINETVIDDRNRWRDKILKTLKQAYRKSEHVGLLMDLANPLSDSSLRCLADLNIAIIEKIAKKFSLKTRFVRSSQLYAKGGRTERLVEICKEFSATEYLSPVGSRDYLKAEEYRFKEAGIKLVYQNYPPPVYPQSGSRFFPYLSILDLFGNAGLNSLAYIQGFKASLGPYRTVSTTKSILFRVDGGAAIGSGHIIRCMALAQASRHFDFQAHFAMSSGADVFERRFTEEGIKLHLLSGSREQKNDVAELISLAKDLKARWIVLDKYGIDADYQRSIREAGFNSLMLDDLGDAFPYSANLILNQNIFAQEDSYKDKAYYTRLLLGTNYALLRDQFLCHPKEKDIIPQTPYKILVTLGGGDHSNFTTKVMEALLELQDLVFECIVVVGDNNPFFESIHRLAALSQGRIRVKKGVADMAQQMSWADMALTGSGSTCWETLFAKIPSAVFAFAPHQEWIGKALEDKGAVIYMGKAGDVSPARIREVIKAMVSSPELCRNLIMAGSQLVDGKGAKRVLKAMLMYGLEIRHVSADDCEMLWHWANDPVTREASFTTEPIEWEEHKKWFSAKLNSKECSIYIGLNYEQKPLGQVRYDILDEEATVSISIDKSFQNQGYGTALLLNSAALFIKEKPDVKIINAYIKNINQPSIWTFLKAGYNPVGLVSRHRGFEELHLATTREQVQDAD